MKTRTISPLLLAACLPWLGCRQEEAEHDEAPYAYRAGAGRETVPDGGDLGDDTGYTVEGVNWSGVVPFVARNEAQGTLALAALQSLISAFIAKGKTLDLAKTPQAIAAEIAAEITAKICPTSTASYTAGAAYLTVALGSKCLLGGSGLAASGTVVVGVTASSGGAPWAAVALGLSNVGMDGYTVDGYATLATDGNKDTLDTRMTLSGLGTIVFHGTSSGDGASVSLDGTGTWTGTELSPPVSSRGWECVSSRQSALNIRAVGKTFADCYASRGSLDIVRPYACLRHVGGGATEMTSLVSTSSLKFLPATPATGNVTVSVSGSGGSINAAASPTPLPENACLTRTKAAK